ncbi:FCD domain-containing protein [Xanthobacter sp. KR7-65]|uniref:GntR family transcriptional regulator n=1 Tax=Xanthobacter sp. KR7-65 TaxID=3156612 RepID=UPI0032B3D011
MQRPDAPPRERTLSDRAYKSLHRDIMSGRLTAGSKLKLEGLVAEYEVGMSPLREALTRLVGDLLVVSEGQRGFWVAPLSVAELDDVVRVRALVETEAIGQAIRLGDAEWEACVRRAFETLSAVEARLPESADALPQELIEEWESANQAFHAALVSACGSPWLIRLRDLLYRQSERYRRVSLNVSRQWRSVHEEHLAIFNAAMARNTLRACRMTEEHLGRTADEVRRAILALSDGSEGDAAG